MNLPFSSRSRLFGAALAAVVVVPFSASTGPAAAAQRQLASASSSTAATTTPPPSATTTPPPSATTTPPPSATTTSAAGPALVVSRPSTTVPTPSSAPLKFAVVTPFTSLVPVTPPVAPIASDALAGATPPGRITHIESDDHYAERSTDGKVFFARVAGTAPGGSDSWSLRIDFAIANDGSSPIVVDAAQLITDVSSANASLLDAPLSINPGKSALAVPDRITGTGAFPRTLTVKARIIGYAQLITKTVELVEFRSNTPTTGYRFPARAEDLPAGAHWYFGDHANTTAQRYAYDLHVRRWRDGTGWTPYTEMAYEDDAKGIPKGSKNEHSLVFGLPLYAAADATIVRCSRSIPENIFGEKVDGGGNTLILNMANGEYLAYYHLQQYSIPEALCTIEGAGADDHPLSIPVPEGTFLGRVGNSGHSDGPHLHIDLKDDVVIGSERGLPLRFVDLSVHAAGSKTDATATEAASAPGSWRRVRAGDAATIGPDTLFRPNPCGWRRVDPTSKAVSYHGIAEDCYQDRVDDLASAGFQVRYLDGFDVDGKVRFNAVWRKSDGIQRPAVHGLTKAQFETVAQDQIHNGFRPIHVDSYFRAGQVRYAGVFEKGFPTNAPLLYIGWTKAQHQAKLDQVRVLGFHPVAVSVLSVGGQLQYTVLWEKSDIGVWALDSTIAAGDYQGVYDAAKAAGRHLLSLQAYRHNGAVWYAAVFASKAPVRAAMHGVTSDQYQAGYDTQVGLGRFPALVTGVGAGGEARYSAGFA